MKDQFLTVLVIGAILISGFALIAAIGSAVRVQRLETLLHPAVPKGLPVGAAVPNDVMATFLEDAQLSRWVDGPSLLLFVSAHCNPCRALIEKLNVLPANQLCDRIATVETGRETTEEEFESLRRSVRFSTRWVARSAAPQLQSAFQVGATPQAFLVKDGKVLKQVTGPDVEPLLADSREPARLL